MTVIHIAPVEVVTGIEVPQRTHHPLASTILMQVDAARRRELNIIDKLLNLQVFDERRDVEELLHLLVVLCLDGLLELGKLSLHRVHGVCSCIFVFRIFHGCRHAVDLRIEVVVGIRAFARAVVDVECKQDATLVADVDTVLALLHLLSELVDATIVAIDEHLDIAGMIRKRQAKPLSHLKNKGVHEVGDVAVVGQQHPALRLVESKQLVLLVKFDAIRLLVVPQPRAVATPTNGGRSRVVAKGATAVQQNLTGHVLLVRGDLLAIVGGDIELEHLIFVFRLNGRLVLEGQAVYIGKAERHNGIAPDVKQQLALVATHIGIGQAVGNHGEVPLRPLRRGVNMNALLGKQS